MSVEEALEFLRVNLTEIRKRCTPASIPELLSICIEKGFLDNEESGICNHDFTKLTPGQKWHSIYETLQSKQEITMKGVGDIFSGSSNSHILKYIKSVGFVYPMDIPKSNTVQKETGGGGSQVLASKALDDVLVYKLKSTPKGRVLILNNDFMEHPDLKKRRRGSDLDVKRLQDFFEIQGFQVDSYLNKNGNEFRGIISDFIEGINKKPLDSVFVIIMSHGGEGGEISMAGNTKINLFKDVIQKFSNHNKGLRDKPKIFITGACRGGARDGIFCQSEGEEEDPDTCKSGSIYPNFSDALLIFPTHEGFTSFRNPAKGSELICNLLEAFEEKPHDSLQDQLIRANSKIQEHFGCAKPCMEKRDSGFKKFYFNPPEDSNFTK